MTLVVDVDAAVVVVDAVVDVLAVAVVVVVVAVSCPLSRSVVTSANIFWFQKD